MRRRRSACALGLVGGQFGDEKLLRQTLGGSVSVQSPHRLEQGIIPWLRLKQSDDDASDRLPGGFDVDGFGERALGSEWERLRRGDSRRAAGFAGAIRSG